jgi:hypothetical protein
MRYATIKNLSDAAFKRATGVQRKTFDQMLHILETAQPTLGRPPTLPATDQLLMTLMYWREYRTEFHIGLTYGVSEASVCRIVHKVETALLRSGQFRLPGKKVLRENDMAIEVVVVDATEQPIERPKKNNAFITAGKRSGIRKKPK